MQEIFIGEAIRKRRLELGLTQEELCQGICEPITLSRLENGKQTPTRSRVNALLERLDMPTDRYYALVSQRELEVESLHKQIVLYNVQFRHASPEKKGEIREKGLDAHKKLVNIIDKDDSISRQLILRSEVVLGTQDGPYSPEEQREKLMQAMKETIPEFDLDEIGRNRYTLDEIKIINQLAITYVCMDEHMEAIDIWNRLYKYMKKHLKKLEQAKVILTMVIGNLANELDGIGQYEKAIQLAEEGQRICIEKGCYRALPGLLAIMAECWHFLGDDRRSKDLYLQSYYLYKALGGSYDLANIRKEAKEYLALEIVD